MRQLKEFSRSLVSIISFWRVIWNWRWYDYSYTLDILERDLQLRLRYWGTKTHYIGDKFTRGRMLVLLKNLQEYREAEWQNEARAWKLFMTRHARTLGRLWD